MPSTTSKTPRQDSARGPDDAPVAPTTHEAAPAPAIAPYPPTVYRKVARDASGLPIPVEEATSPDNHRAAQTRAVHDDSSTPRPELGAHDRGLERNAPSGTADHDGGVLPNTSHPADLGVDDLANDSVIIDEDLVQESVDGSSPNAGIRLTRTIPREGSALPPRESGAHEEAPTLINRDVKEVADAFAGRFDIVRQIGRGGMGSVFLARQPGTPRLLALKVLHGLRNKKDLLRFEREMSLMARISHPNVVKVFDYGQASNGATFLAMEYVEGQTLFELLYRERLLSLEKTLRIAYYTALGLGAAHEKGIIHRDVKPENIMVSDHHGIPDFAQILDFGIAREAKSFGAGAVPLTSGGVFLGTPRYAAPEAIRGERLTPRTDIYSLGCLLFQLLAERCPFEDPSPLTVMDQHLKYRPTPMMKASLVEIPPEIGRLVDAMLSKRPEYRPESMTVVADRLAPFVETRPGTVRARMNGSEKATEATSAAAVATVAVAAPDIRPKSPAAGSAASSGTSSSQTKGGDSRTSGVPRANTRQDAGTQSKWSSLTTPVMWFLLVFGLAGWILYFTRS